MTKHKSSEPQYDKFRFKHDDIAPEAINKIVDARERFYAPTGTDGQRLAVYRTMPENPTSLVPIVRPPAWSDEYGRPEGGRFDAYLAEATGHPVLSPNAPGVEFSKLRDPNNDDAHRMTYEQRRALIEDGSFARVGGAVMRATRAAAQHFGGLEEEYIIDATSQGVAFAGGMVRRALDDGIKLKGIVLGEGVNYTERPLPLLGRQFIAENGMAPGYLEQNPPLGEESMGRWLRRTLEAMPGANWPYARGLARAAFLADIGDVSGLARDEQDTAVFMTRGTASSLSSAEGDAAVADHFRRNGVAVGYEEFDGHRHPYTMTIQYYVDGVNEVA